MRSAHGGPSVRAEPNELVAAIRRRPGAKTLPRLVEAWGTAMNRTEPCTPERTRRHDHASNPPRSARTTARRVVRHWAPVACVFAGAVGARRLVLDRRYDVGGHAAEHLTSASAPFMAVVVVAVLARAEPRVLRSPAVSLSALTWLATTVVVMVGNLRVVDDLVAAGHAHTPTGLVPDIADHSLANAAPWFAVAASLAVVLTCRRGMIIGNRLAGGAAAASVLVPPWILPGAGVIVLAAAMMWRTIRSDKRSESGLGTA